MGEAHAHHGITVLPDGNILTGHASEPKGLVLTPDGRLEREFEVPAKGTHGLAWSHEEGRLVLWVTDIVEPQVVKTDLEGRLLARLGREDFPLGEGDGFCPTATSIDPATGEVWVADGYGSSTVHCFGPDLKHRRMRLVRVGGPV